ncbi:MAG: hypothetical protein U1D30_14780 [Planctomycetota bacterium]
MERGLRFAAGLLAAILSTCELVVRGEEGASVPDATLQAEESYVPPDLPITRSLEIGEEDEELIDPASSNAADARGPRRPNFGRKKAPFQVTGNWVPQQAVDDQPYALGWQSIAASGGMPVWKSGPTMVFLNTEVQQARFSRDGGPGGGAIVAPDPAGSPDTVANVALGTRVVTAFDNGWSRTLSLNVGSASDQPFHSSREWNIGTMGSLIIPRGDDGWMFSLFYSPTSQLWFPVPGIAYLWNPNEDLSVSLGIPFALNWQMTPIWRLEANYVPVTNINTRLVAKLSEKCEVYVGYLARNRSAAARRPRRLSRPVHDLRATVGERHQIPLAAHLALELLGGYSFGRYLYEGGFNPHSAIAWTFKSSALPHAPTPRHLLSKRTRT